ncbi:hypothetical protein [Chitinophaga ginsengisoli]|uniref:Uncharacterized protein n=1 Tax=Chitinophaga ginsengisoli TaxID=363837 RepID=A0A2P8G4X1_9BACT|nr:hypothetical protein [Chitinophaga ginsengisoli]PSL29019.1 hypothetical protein CLV42_107165 [Chitinophaga ginsengisoli]
MINPLSALSQSAIPPDLVAWLAQFKNLQGVPFNYLVTDERLLPPETIRFFQVDATWSDALVDGAMSIGRQYTTATQPSPDLMAEQAHRISMDKLVNTTQANIRRLQFKGAVPADVSAATVITGFLLRSVAVSSWPGMEVAGYAKNASPYDNEKGIITPDQIQALDILRLENLSSTVLIGLFNGPLYELVLHQPPEAIHFGFTAIDPVNNSVSKSLRVPAPGWDDAISYKEDKNVSFDAFTDATHRVLDLQKMSQLMGQTFHKMGIAPGYFPQQQAMLSSDFGLQMVQGVGLVSFINDVAGESI